MATQALEITPQQDSRLRSLGYYALASACALMEDYPGAVEAYRLSIQHGQAGVNPMTETMSTVGLAGMALEHGQLHLAFEIASQAVERIERSGALPPISAVVYAALGDVKTEWFQLEVARRHLLRALHLSALGGANTATIFCHALLSRLCQLEGDMEEAALEIQKAAELIPLEAPEYIQQEIVAQQVNIELARRRPYLAEMALQGLGFAFQGGFTYPALPDGEGIAYSLGLLYASSLRFLLYQVQSGKDASRLKPGMALADDLIDRASNSQRLSIALEALLLRAQMHTALRNNQASQADYVNALELAEPEGFIGLFVEQGQPVAKALEDLAKRGRLGKVEAGYVEGILEAFRRQPTVVSTIENAPAALIEPLTGRELEVLRLMAEGLKYKEIAAQLFISQNTVRFHVKAIYGKLNASNRTQAIALARQIQIL
jgi:LuxR family maltose regulon positive regulatory protein